MIKLLIDTTCDLNNSITDNYDIEVIPLNIVINDVLYLDGVDINLDTVYKYMRTGIMPKTSQVSYDSVTKAFDKCVLNNDDFIYLAFSSKLSGTYNFANGILKTYKERYPERKMEIIDSKGGSGGTALAVIQAIKMIKNELPFEEIVKQIRFMVDHTKYYFTLPDLKWLVSGGRVKKTIGYVGDALNIKPYLTVNNGKIILSKVVHGSKKVINTLINDVQSGTSKFKNQIIAISHADDLNTALMVEEKIKNAVEGCKTTIFQIGAVLGIHLGIGGVAVFFFDAEPEFYIS